MNYKKIAMLSLHTCPLAQKEGHEVGGMNVYVLKLSIELSKKGYQVDVFTRLEDDKKAKIVEVSPGFRVIHLKAGPTARVPKKEIINYVPEFVKSFNDFTTANNIKYDILHCHYYLSGLAGISIKNKNHKNTPLIINFHTLALMKNLVARDELEREQKERIDAEKMLTKEADKIIASSESDMEYIQYLYECPKEKISVINPGVDTNLFKPIKKEEARKIIKADLNHKIILFVGRIEPLKGIDGLMYAIKILLKRNPKLFVCLWIVGGWSPELQRLEDLRKVLNLTTVVKFVGQQPQEKLPYYFSASDVVVIPSHYESFGMVALEAMACGIPVITTNVTGIASLLDKKHESLITSSNNPLLLAHQIERIITNQKDQKLFGKDLLSKVQDLNWENVSSEVLKIYQYLEI